MPYPPLEYSSTNQVAAWISIAYNEWLNSKSQGSYGRLTVSMTNLPSDSATHEAIAESIHENFATPRRVNVQEIVIDPEKGEVTIIVVE